MSMNIYTKTVFQKLEIITHTYFQAKKLTELDMKARSGSSTIGDSVPS